MVAFARYWQAWRLSSCSRWRCSPVSSISCCFTSNWFYTWYFGFDGGIPWSRCYSNCCRTNVLFLVSLIFLRRKTSYRVLFAFLVMFLTYGHHKILLSMVTAMLLTLLVIYRTCPLMECQALMIVCSLEIMITSHLSVLELISQNCLSRSFCNLLSLSCSWTLV